MIRSGKLFSVIVLFVLFSSSLPAVAETIAAAASLQPFLEKVIPWYNGEKGTKLEGVYGASGNLARQIEMGAPFDIFLSANEQWARYVEEKGLLANPPLPFTSMPLVLWQAGAAAPDLELIKSTDKKIAIANPEAAPFGKQAKEYLIKKGYFDEIEKSDRLILGGDVLKTALAAKSGGADLAILPLSIALKMDDGSWTLLDTPPQVLFGAIVKGKFKEAVEGFWAFLRSPEAEPFMKEFGFVPAR